MQKNTCWSRCCRPATMSDMLSFVHIEGVRQNCHFWWQEQKEMKFKTDRGSLCKKHLQLVLFRLNSFFNRSSFVQCINPTIFLTYRCERPYTQKLRCWRARIFDFDFSEFFFFLCNSSKVFLRTLLSQFHEIMMQKGAQ